MSIKGLLKTEVTWLASNSYAIPATTPGSLFTCIPNASTPLSSVYTPNIAANTEADVLFGQLYVSITGMPSGVPGGLLNFQVVPRPPGVGRPAMIQGNSASDGNLVGVDPGLTTDPFGNTISASHPLDVVGGVTLWGTDFDLVFSCQEPATASGITFSANLVLFNTWATVAPPGAFAAASPNIFPTSVQGG